MGLSETGKALLNKLKEYFNDKDFIIGVMSNAPGDKNWNTLLHFIEKAEALNDTISSDEILALSIVLGKSVEEK